MSSINKDLLLKIMKEILNRYKVKEDITDQDCINRIISIGIKANEKEEEDFFKEVIFKNLGERKYNSLARYKNGKRVTTGEELFQSLWLAYGPKIIK